MVDAIPGLPPGLTYLTAAGSPVGMFPPGDLERTEQILRDSSTGITDRRP
jgi:hypothetical protein